MQEVSDNSYKEDMKLFKGLELSVWDFTDSNLHWVKLLFLSMILNVDQKDKSLENKTGGVYFNIPFPPY